MIVPRAVQPLALLIHELCVNAVSHGSLSQPSGRIMIRWDFAVDRNSFVLNWREIGGRPPTAIRRRGFGTLIADAIVRRQLNGAVAREWLQEGLKVTVDVPNAIAWD